MKSYSHPPCQTCAIALAVGAPAATGAVLCAVSLIASARPLKLDLPKISLPKLPDLDLPNFGKKKSSGADDKPKPRTAGMNVKVRASRGVTVSGSSSAPTLAELTGSVSQDSIAPGAGWKRFPARRMPGANMDNWKKIAKEITPDV